jgi:hypothetical protein
MQPTDYYQRKVNAGFKPSWVCKSATEFADSFRARFGQPLLLRALPGEVKASGIDYAHTLTARTLAVLMSVEEQPVLVLVDTTAGKQGSLRTTNSAGLGVFRRDIGRLVLYEVSPFDQPRVLDLFFDPDVEHPTDINTRWIAE